MYPEVLREHIQKCKKATDKPFGVNVPMLYPNIQEIMDIIVDEGVNIVFTSAGNPKTWTSWLSLLLQMFCFPCHNSVVPMQTSQKDAALMWTEMAS